MRGLLIIAFMLCSACAIGPDFVHPEVQSPDKWENSETNVSKVELTTWWNELQDPTLTKLIEQGFDANLDIKQATERLRQARAGRLVAFSPLLPSVSASADGRRAKSAIRSDDNDNVVVNRNSSISELYQVGFDAAWELDIFGGNRRSFEASTALFEAAAFDQAQIRITVAGEIGAGYLNLRGLQKQLEIVTRNADIQERNRQIIEKKVEAGFANALDLENARGEVATTRAAIPNLRAEIEVQKYQLAVLLGQTPETDKGELNTGRDFPSLPTRLPDDLPVTLLERRPDVRAAEARLHAATANVGVADAEFLPKFSISAFFGATDDTWSQALKWHNELWNIAGSAVMPLFQGGRLVGNLEIARSERDEALLFYEQTVLNALQEVESALQRFRNERARAVDLEVAIVANQKALELSEKLYREGMTDFINVLNAERSVLSSEQALIQSRQAALQNLISLYKALGGGWEVPSA